MLRFYLFLSLLVSFACAGNCEPANSPKYEMRGAWLVTAYGLDWPSCQGTNREIANIQKQQLDELIENLYDVGINAVFFQVRPMADAFYDSSFEPWSAYLTGTRGVAASYDPLAYCIDKCHALGIECHAWINPFRVGTELPSTRLDDRTKKLWMTNRVGRVRMTIFNPAFDETREHLCNVCREIATQYDVDGIVFDDYFYNPEFIPEDKRAADWKHYLKAAENGQSMADWRRENINKTIAEVHSLLATVKEGKIRFGISPQGIAGGNGVYECDGVPSLLSYGVTTGDSQYGKIYSDPVRWLKDGLVDYVSPQIYWGTDNERHPYGGLARWWNDVAEMYGRHCYPSQTITSFAKNKSRELWDETFRQIVINRESSFNYAPGSVLYSARFIVGDAYAGFGRELSKRLFTHRALVPPMRWKSGVTQLAVTELTLDGSGRLHWAAVDDARYVIYCIPDSVSESDALSLESDGLDASYIIAVTYDNCFNLPKKYRKGHRIAVSPYDRYGIEWQPTFL